MAMRKNISVMLFVAGAILLVWFILLGINASFHFCDSEKHNYDNATITCSYFSSACNEGEVLSNIDGNNVCKYTAKGVLDIKETRYTLYSIIALWLIILGVFIYYNNKEKNKKDNMILPKRAKELLAIRLCEKHNLPVKYIDGYKDVVWKEKDIVYTGNEEPFRKGNEWFLKIQYEINDSRTSGIQTAIVNLSKGEEWILNDGARIQTIFYDGFKISRNMPLNTPEDVQERIIESLKEVDPDKALDVQVDRLKQESQQQQENPDEQIPQQQVMQQRPVYRRPQQSRYRRRY